MKKRRSGAVFLCGAEVPDGLRGWHRLVILAISTTLEHPMRYHGSCHCGRVSFEVEGELGTVMECNCSHCSRKGYLLWFVPREHFELTAADADMGSYRFNKHVIDHRFCRNCGCAPFAYGTMPDGQAMASINVRCLEGVELESLVRQPVDGRAF